MTNHHNLLYILTISAFFAVLLFNPNLQPNVWDSYEYLNVGKAIAQGKGHVQIWNPDEPLHWRSVGYSYLLSLLMRFSENLIYLKCFSLLCYFANIILIYFLFLKIFRLPNVIIFILSLIINLNPITIFLSNVILSDTPFYFMQLLSLIAVTQYVVNDRNISIYILIIPLFMICSWQIRSIGLAIILAVFFYLLIGKHYKKLIIISLCMTPMILFIYSNNNNGIGVLDNYNILSDLTKVIYDPKAFIQLIFDGFVDYFYIIPKSLFGVFYDTVGHLNLHTMLFFKIILFAFTLFVIIMIIIGYIILLGSHNLYGIYIAIYVAVLLIYPINFPRAIFPLFPFLLVYFFYGVQLTLQKIPTNFRIEKKYSLTTIIFLVLLFFSTGEKLYRAFSKKENIISLSKSGLSSYPLEWQNYFNGLFWLKTNVPDDSIILTRDSSLCFLISDRQSVSIEDSKNMNDVKILMDNQNVDYVIANPYYKNAHEKFLFDLIKENSNNFFQVYGNNDSTVRIFKIIKINSK